MTTWGDLFGRTPEGVTVEEVREALDDRRSAGGDGPGGGDSEEGEDESGDSQERDDA